ncbi:uncharacterized protein MONOS_17969 [Monocercomonoides exilis]|uniref:uncharacterized protein n=1 Tax=Monocercomonoides exilis TaxID=2049356 RepID=UPI0035597087|nr:hypothetical protein MONOS_17969 [Monocercomonoides exilis]
MDGRRRYKSFHRFAKRKYYRYPGINKALLYYLRKGEESRRKTLQAVRRYGQGRVENWKQTKQTVQIPQNQIIQMESTTPAGDDIQRSDYINYMSRYKFTFNVGPVNPGDAQRYWQVPYVRVLVFRKWGYRPNENNDLKNIIYTMFKYPELITSGYVKNFRRIWCKQYGVQLYIDKLLRVTGDTNYVTEYECKIYPKKHTRYDGFGDRARWYYDAVILAGTVIIV